MSLLPRAKKESPSYTAAVLQALQEAPPTSSFPDTGKKVAYLLDEHLVPEHELSFAVATAQQWATRHSDLVATVLPNHEAEWMKSPQFAAMSQDEFATRLLAFRVHCVQDCIMQYLENQREGPLDQKVAEAIKLAEANAANVVH